MKQVTIRVRGVIDKEWSEWLGNLVIDHVGTHTKLTGTVSDSAALYGLLNKIRNMGLELVSVDAEEAGQKSTGK